MVKTIAHNILIVARKQSGKTTLSLDIMDKLIKKYNITRITFISPTSATDKAQSKFIKDNSKITDVYTGVKEMNVVDGKPIITDVLKDMAIRLNSNPEDEVKAKDAPPVMFYFGKPKEKPIKSTKPKKEYEILYLDDNGDDTRGNRYLDNLLRISRHKNLFIVCASHNIINISKSVLCNFDYVYLGYGIPEDYLAEVTGRFNVCNNQAEILEESYPMVEKFTWLLLDNIDCKITFLKANGAKTKVADNDTGAPTATA